jgi:hypothetical protein
LQVLSFIDEHSSDVIPVTLGVNASITSIIISMSLVLNTSKSESLQNDLHSANVLEADAFRPDISY